MKFIFILIILFISCSDSTKQINQKFIATYKEILLIRESFPDTTIANPKVDSLLNANNYTEKKFRDEMFLLMKNNKEMLKVLDSLRNEINKEVRKED